MRADMPRWLLVAIPILIAALTYFIWHYIAEIRFYQKHNWDFSILNPKGKKFYHGRYASSDDSNLMSNHTRIWWGYPFFIFVTGFIFLGFSYTIYRIQSCAYDDLKKCGIETQGSWFRGKVSIGSPPSQ
ncbi:MAG: hypothetical protein ABIN69_00130 [Aestuariivirga sp.]